MEPANPSPSKPVMDVAPPKAASGQPQPQSQQPVASAAAPAPQAKPVAAEHPSQGQSSGSLEVHPAPADDQPAATNKAQDTTNDVQEHAQPQKSHASMAPKQPHPVREIVILTILVMIILSGLAVLVYLNA